MTTWFISDTHFFHKNILEFEKEHRPFSSLDEMHEVMIERWNSVVKPADKVYHLGDVIFGKKNFHLLGRLNGKKRLILGNHDCYGIENYLAYFEKIYGSFNWHKRCVLTHIPVHMSLMNNRYFLNVHGHLHSRTVMHTIPPTRGFTPDKWYLNVSCEQNNLTPIHEDVIRNRLIEIDS